MGTAARAALRRLTTFDRVTAVVAAALVIPAVFVTPLRVFAVNVSEFPANLTEVVRTLSTLTGLALVLCYGLGRLWPGVAMPGMGALAVIVGLESALFFPLAGHAPFDGSAIDWSQWQSLSAIEIVAALAVVAVAVVARQREQLAMAAGVAILLFNALGLGTTLHERWEEIEIHDARHDYSYFGGFHRLSRTRNVVHVVFDTTQGAMVEALITADPDRYEPVFDGFTRFPQAMGRYPSTYPSVPYYMTGRAIEPERDFVAAQPLPATDLAGDLREASIVGALAGAGFRTFGYQCCRLYCSAPYRACAAGDVFDGRPLEIDDVNAAIRRLLDLALFQITPIVVRERIYDDGDWWLRARRQATRTYSAIVDAFVAYASADGPAESYNYFHLAGAHVPLQFDEQCRYVGPQPITTANQRRQVRCALRQLERLVETLERLGVYDQTLIVAHGDHGTPGLPPAMAARAAGAEFLIGSASALLMIKPPNARGRMRVSDAPAELGDIPRTIADALGLKQEFPGESLLVLQRGPRERQFLSYDDSNRVASLQALPNLRRYRVQGDLFDQRAWSGPEMAAAGQPRSALFMDDPEFHAFATGFGALERQVKPARWVTARRARVRLALPAPEPVQLVLEAFAPARIPGQSVTVSVNGRVIARLTAATLGGGRHAISIPAGLVRPQVNVIELTPAKAVTPPGDHRRLSMVLSYIGLEPAR
jgi:hypothetical protein